MNVKRAILSQPVIFNMLKASKEAKRMSHAYLFYGEEGTGKKEMAYALACMLYCEHGGCLECDTCKTILSGNHMNVDYIGIADNKTMISKDQITDLQEEFSKTSLVEGTRVYIVDGIDTASSAAQNSLLKFIEEPVNATPTVGIFLATELSNVVNTIQSRCILQNFPAIPLEKRAEMLKSEGIEELDSILAASLTNNTEEALEIAKSEDFIAVRELFNELLTLKDQRSAVLFYSKYLNVFSDNHRLSMLLQWVLLFLEDVLLRRSNNNLILTPLYDKIEVYYKKNKDSLKQKMEYVLELFNQLKYNISPKNVFHELMMNFV